MTEKEFSLIKRNSKIFHKHLGKCQVKEIKYGDIGAKVFSNLFGIIIKPLTDEGKILLHYYSGMP